jgi:hypothetical protein
LKVCRKLRDPLFRTYSAIDIFLMTRPPSVIDIAYRLATSGRTINNLIALANAVRGTSYPHGLVQQRDSILDISSPLLFGSVQRRMDMVLGNLLTEKNWFDAAAQGRPVVTRRRVRDLGIIVNEAIDHRKRTGNRTILLLPELSIPRRWVRRLASRLLEENVDLVTGLEYRKSGKKVVNEAIGVFGIGYRAGIVCSWRKNRPATGELIELARLNLRLQGDRKPSVLTVNTDSGTVGTLICSELLDIVRRSTLLGRVDVLLVPAWNPDTSTFEHTIQTASNDLHCYVAVANNAKFSDCRIYVPLKKRYLRDVTRIVCRDQPDTIAASLDLDALRLFQKESLRHPTHPPDDFKPIPPGYRFHRPD